MTAREVRTTCAYCGVGCGMVVTVGAAGRTHIAGDPSHPANAGRLCQKGATLGETLDSAGRVLVPYVDGVPVGMSRALDEVAARFAATIARHGPESVAFYLSGQLSIEDYYVANKLMKGWLGTANIDTNSRLCMASAVAGHRRAFGEDVVPGVYADLEEADLVVLVGSNLAWCHPVLSQRLQAARERQGTRVVVIDPRATATSAEADLHLAIAPGSDVALFNGLLRYLAEFECLDRDYLRAHTTGIADALAVAREHDLPRVAAQTGLAPAELRRFYDWFALTPRTVTAWSQGVNQSRAGTDKVNAIINCHLATGRIGQPGAGPLSLTGQPNAMGGREVGGLATTLAAHREFDEPGACEALQAFWRSPRIARRPGLKAVEMFEAMADGRIKAVWIMATNPLASLPDSARARAALERCPLVVVSEAWHEAVTAQLAHVLLPAAAWGEKDGTVSNSERCLSRQRAFRAPPGAARPDWWMVCEVARRLGAEDGFDYAGPAQILREHAALSAALPGRRELDLGALAALDEAGYQRLVPQAWPAPAGQTPQAPRRLFSDGRFAHADGRARLVPTPYQGLDAAADPHLPYVLNTGRARDQWHTMTRSGRVPRLGAHCAEPFVELHPADAVRHGVGEAELVEVLNGDARVVARALVTTRARPGRLFAPMHFSSAHASHGAVNRLVPARTDPHSGQPESKAARVALRRYPAAWYGFAVSRANLSPICDYWARMPTAGGGWRLECADSRPLDDVEAWFAQLCGDAPGEPPMALHDARRGVTHLVAMAGGRLLAALYVAPTPVAVAREWLCAQLAAPTVDVARAALLAGRPPASEQPRSAPLCVCGAVDAETLRMAVQAGHASLAALAAATGAGAGCGGCRSDLQRLISQCAPRPTAEPMRSV